MYSLPVLLHRLPMASGLLLWLLSLCNFQGASFSLASVKTMLRIHLCIQWLCIVCVDDNAGQTIQAQLTPITQLCPGSASRLQSSASLACSCTIVPVRRTNAITPERVLQEVDAPIQLQGRHCVSIAYLSTHLRLA